MRRLIRSEPGITRNLILALTGGMILFWLLAIALSILVMRHEMDEIFDSSLEETTQRLLVLIVDDLDLRGTSADEGAVTLKVPGEREYLTYQMRDAQGTILLRSGDAPNEPFDAPLKTGFHDTQKQRIYTQADAKGMFFLQVADRFSDRREAVRETAMTMLIPLAVLIPGSILAIWFIVGRTLRPIDRLRRDIAMKDGGNMLPIESAGLPQELKPIAQSVNLLLDRLHAAFEAEREFTSNSAHELRTPIAGALAQTQRLIEELPPGHARGRALHVEKSLVDLARLTAKLLQLARAEAGIGTRTQAIDLRQILDMIAQDFRRDAATAGRLSYQPPSDVDLVRKVDVDAFGILMRNLIENAIIHGDPADPVRLSIDRAGAIRVINSGAVIAGHDMTTLKTRFHRGRTEASGSGLGLAIAERLVSQMGGRLELFSPAEGESVGFEARVTLPQA